MPDLVSNPVRAALERLLLQPDRESMTTAVVLLIHNMDAGAYDVVIPHG